MLKERARILAISVFTLDLSLVATGFFIAYWLRSEMLPALAILPGRLYPLEQYAPLLLLGLLIWGLLLATSGLYRSHRTIPLLDEAFARSADTPWTAMPDGEMPGAARIARDVLEPADGRRKVGTVVDAEWPAVDGVLGLIRGIVMLPVRLLRGPRAV